MANNQLFIVLEGLNGCGKTTIANMIARNIGAVYVTTPSVLFKGVRDAVDIKADDITRFLFYLAGTHQSSREISDILASGVSVVCDRYYYTTICAAKAMGLAVHIPDFLCFKEPDYTFLVTCEHLIRISRMVSRGMNVNDYRERHDDVEGRTLQYFREYRMREVDNTHDISKAVAEIMGHIGE